MGVPGIAASTSSIAATCFRPAIPAERPYPSIAAVVADDIVYEALRNFGHGNRLFGRRCCGLRGYNSPHKG